MEFFNEAKAVRFRSHLDKFLLADDDEETVRQSRNGSSRKAIWIVEFVEGNSHIIRLKSCFGKYLTASDVPFLLGMTGKKVLQSSPAATKLESSIEWEPIREEFQVKLRTRGGKFLRANGGTPPWRNSITHDVPHRSKTQNWVLWDVDMVEIPENESFSGYQSQLSSLSSMSEFEYTGSEPGSPWSVASTRSSFSSSNQIAVEVFHNAKAIRLKSRHKKYLFAEEDEESVSQNRNGSSRNARWIVEFVEDSKAIRLKSCYGKYLSASNSPFLLGMTGKKVLQSSPKKLDSSVEWEPVKEGLQIKLKTRYGNFLRANGGLPPWKNSITHDIPQRTVTQDWVLWDIDIVEIQIRSPDHQSPTTSVPESDNTDSFSSSPSESFKSPKLEKLESMDSFVSSHSETDGRIIYYNIGDINGKVETAIEGPSIVFKGSGVDELTRQLEEETGLEDIIVCSHNPLNGKLYPLRLHLPPNNATMNLVLVQASSEVAKDFTRLGNLT